MQARAAPARNLPTAGLRPERLRSARRGSHRRPAAPPRRPARRSSHGARAACQRIAVQRQRRVDVLDGDRRRDRSWTASARSLEIGAARTWTQRLGARGRGGAAGVDRGRGRDHRARRSAAAPRAARCPHDPSMSSLEHLVGEQRRPARRARPVPVEIAMRAPERLVRELAHLRVADPQRGLSGGRPSTRAAMSAPCPSRTRGPSRARSPATRLRSSDAPVVIDPNTICSAAPPPEQHRHEVDQLLAGLEIAVLLGQVERVAERPAVRDDRDPVHAIDRRQQLPAQGVTRLVIGDDALLVVGQRCDATACRRSTRSSAAVEVAHRDLVGITPPGEDRRLIADVGEVGAGQARGLAREQLRGRRPRRAACRASGRAGSAHGR